MTAADLFQRLIRAYAAPALKQHGYKSAGPTFYLQRPPNWGLINFQTLALAGSPSLQFTINLAVVSGRLRAGYYPDRAAARPTASEGDFQQRIGFLLPPQHDYWWTIAACTGLEWLGPE